jgi:hypothetical protein
MRDYTPYDSAADAIRTKISDLISDFLYYDRKEDEILPVGEIERVIRAGEITVDDIIAEFARELRSGLKDVKKEEPPARDRIGTVTTLLDRVYAVDPDDDIADPKTVVGLFSPGDYPVYREQETGLVYWEAENAIPSVWSGFETERLGGGLFALIPPHHKPTGAPPVTVRSKKFTPEEFEELLADPGCTPGPEQRLIFNLDEL